MRMPSATKTADIGTAPAYVPRTAGQSGRPPTLAIATVLVLLMALTILLTDWNAAAEVQVAEARDIALTLFNQYMFAFLALGVLLLAGVIGGLYLAKRDDDMPETNSPLRAGPDGEEGA